MFPSVIRYQKMGVIFRAFIFFAVINYITANEENDNWPSYFKKCERNSSESDFNNCLFYHANKALQLGSLFQGDDYHDFPKLIPFSALQSVTLGTNKSFKIILNDAKLYGLNFADIYQMRWDLQKKTIFIEIHYSNSLTLQSVYESYGTFQNRSINSHGLAYFSFLDGHISYNLSYTTDKINNYEYATLSKCVATRTEEYPRFYLTQDGVGDRFYSRTPNLNEFFNKYNKELNNALNNDFSAALCRLVTRIFVPLFLNFPLDVIFD